MIRNAFQNRFAFYVTGVYNATKSEQLENKLGVFRDITSTHKAIILTFITPLGVELNA